MNEGLKKRGWEERRKAGEKEEKGECEGGQTKQEMKRQKKTG